MSSECNLKHEIPRSEWAINKGMQLLQEQENEKSEKHAAKTEVAEAQQVKAEEDNGGNECESKQKTSKGWNCFQTGWSVCQHSHREPA